MGGLLFCGRGLEEGEEVGWGEGVEEAEEFGGEGGVWGESWRDRRLRGEPLVVPLFV